MGSVTEAATAPDPDPFQPGTTGPPPDAEASSARDAKQLRDRAEAARARASALLADAAQLVSTNQLGTIPVPRTDLLQYSAYARLQARLETMPVIEQAKGIIMAQTRCDAARAFDLLRQASQRSNVPVRQLAADIVRRASERRRSGHRLWPPTAASSCAQISRHAA
jgi:ANTAR domain